MPDLLSPYFICKMKVKVTLPCPSLCDPMDYTVHGNLQARILEWVAFPFFSRASSQPRAPTQVSRVAGRFLTSGAKGDKGKAKNASQLATGPEIARKSPPGNAQPANRGEVPKGKGETSPQDGHAG